MMRVRRTTLNDLQKIRHERNKRVVFLQRKRKNGEWGKPLEIEMLYGEKTPEDTLNRIARFNPNNEWRIAE